MRWWNSELGVRQILGKHFPFDSALTHDHYRDSQPCLEDYSGKDWRVQLRIHYFFINSILDRAILPPYSFADKYSGFFIFLHTEAFS
jgi:hypothetical protein